jgi:hypothetical protein
MEMEYIIINLLILTVIVLVGTIIQKNETLDVAKNKNDGLFSLFEEVKELLLEGQAKIHALQLQLDKKNKVAKKEIYKRAGVKKTK